MVTLGESRPLHVLALAAVAQLALLGGLTAQASPDEGCDPEHDKLCAVPVPGDAVVAYLLDETDVLPWEGNATLGEGQEVDEGGVRVTANASAGVTWDFGGPEGPLGPGSSVHAIVPCSDPRGCPDLTVDRVDLLADLRIRWEFFLEDDCNVDEGNTEPGFRRVIRFTFTTPNTGEGHLDVGDPASWPGLFEWGQCHGHWHFADYADYRLWTPEGYQQWRDARNQDPDALPEEVLAQHPALEDELVEGRKQGFCMIDIKRHDPTASFQRRYTRCDDQGVSKGWADSYTASLDGQFIDIMDVAPGWYVLEVETNPGRLLEESRYTNNTETLLIFIHEDPLPPS